MTAVAKECALQVSRLLDVPVKQGQHFVVRALDENGQLAATRQVPSSGRGPTETVQLGPVGALQVRTESQTIILQVEYADGSFIGTCHIYRPDPRSATVSQYALTDMAGQNVNCGIEIQVTEGRQQASTGRPDAALQPGSRVVGRLQLKILAAYNLRNRDTGLFGDVSDPFVEAKVGKMVHRTLTIDNNLNPVWTSSNEFTFPVSAEDGQLDLEVINSNVIKNDTLGSTSVSFWSLPPRQWTRRREQLKGGEPGELEFELLFAPAEVSTEVPAWPKESAEVAAPPAPPLVPAAPEAMAGYGAVAPGGLLGPGLALPTGPALAGMAAKGQLPPGSLAMGGLYLPPLTAGWETSIVPRDPSGARAVPALPAPDVRVPERPSMDPRMAEHEMLFPDMYHYEMPKNEPEELWLRTPDPSKADEFFGADRDFEVLAATAEPWRAPVLALHDDVFQDKVFPDMDVKVLLKKEGEHKRGAQAKTEKSSSSQRRRDGLPEFAVDGWVDHVPKPKPKPKPALQDARQDEPRQPLRQLKGQSSAQNASVAPSAKAVSPAVEGRNRRKRAKLKVERELVRPDQARDIEEQLRSPQIVSLDPQLEPGQYEAQVISCLDAEEAVGGERRVWVRTPTTEAAIMEVPENDDQWLEPFQTEELLVGISSRRGRRGSMDPLPCQDCFSLTRLSEDAVLYAVCDGHGPFGHLVAFRVAQSLPSALASELGEDLPELALVKAFEKIEAELVTWAETMSVDISSSGTTCSAALRRAGANMQVAWLGDTRAMVATVTKNSQKVDLVTPGHTTEDVKELQRVRNAGAKLIQVPPNSGHVRIFTPGERTPGLHATRALGDLSAQALGLACQPDVRKMSFARTPGLVLLGSGGFWEMLDERAGPGEETLRLLLGECRLRASGPGSACRRLTAVVQEKWRQAAEDFSDDVSCLLLHFIQPQPVPSVPGLSSLPEEGPAPRAPEEQSTSSLNVSHQVEGMPATPSAPSRASRRSLKPTTLQAALSHGDLLEEARRHCANPALVQPDSRLRPLNFTLQLFGRVEVGVAGSHRGGWLRVLGEGGEVSLSPLDASGVSQVLSEFQVGSSAQVAVCSRQGAGVGGHGLAVNQDCFSLTRGPEGVAVYVVCDGYGPLGHLAAFRAVQSIPKFILETLPESSQESPEQIIAEAFQAAAAELSSFAGSVGLDFSSSGVTASAILRQGDSVHACWLGDSRALVATTSGEFSRVDLMSKPHVAADAGERVRLHKAELRSDSPEEPLRIFSPSSGLPGLAVSRALTPASADLGLSSRPDLAKTSFETAPGLVLLGSGGLHEFMDEGEAVLNTLLDRGQLTSRGPGPALQRLCDVSQELWREKGVEGGCDDLTGLLLYWPGTEPTEAPAAAMLPSAPRAQPLARPPVAAKIISSGTLATAEQGVAQPPTEQPGSAGPSVVAPSTSSCRFLQAHPARSTEGHRGSQAPTPPQPNLPEEQAFCTKCGKDQPPEAVFCRNCGQKREVVEATQASSHAHPRTAVAMRQAASAGLGPGSSGSQVPMAATSFSSAPQVATPGFAPTQATPGLMPVGTMPSLTPATAMPGLAPAAATPSFATGAVATTSGLAQVAATPGLLTPAAATHGLAAGAATPSLTPATPGLLQPMGLQGMAQPMVPPNVVNPFLAAMSTPSFAPPVATPGAAFATPGFAPSVAPSATLAFSGLSPVAEEMSPHRSPQR